MKHSNTLRLRVEKAFSDTLRVRCEKTDGTACQWPHHPYTRAKPLYEGITPVGQSPISSLVLYWKGLCKQASSQQGKAPPSIETWFLLKRPHIRASPLHEGIAPVGQNPISSLVLYCKGLANPTQGPRLFMKAWHQLDKTQYQASSYIGRASPIPRKGLASSLRHSTSWAKSNIKYRLILEGPRLFKKAWHQLGNAQYQVSSYIGRASLLHGGMAPAGQNPISSLVLYWKGLVISTQGLYLFTKAWHQLGKIQYQAWSYIGRASPSPHNSLASSLRHDTSWTKPNIKSRLILEGLLQTSLFPIRKSSSLNWDLVFVETSSPHKNLASS
ncbi:hypothetical protein Adt_11111 [Abeliophyllum distichum]|uniref:Uncharacterized protein n=1 Tax=Abeliophyllum distichum TaxID=126358 RepID=A0ABD1UMB6_9LAMI